MGTRFIWTPERLKIVEDHYAEHGAQFCVDLLGPGCTVKKVFNKAAELGISSNKMRRIAPGAPGTNPEVAREFRINKKAIALLKQRW